MVKRFGRWVRQCGWQIVPPLLILAVALWLRLAGLQAGLAGPGLSPDENTVVPRSLGLLSNLDPNPNWFLYPSLYLYLVAGAVGLASPFIQPPSGLRVGSPEAYALDPAPYILTGRIVSVCAGLALVAATMLLGRQVAGRVAGLLAGAAVAVAPIAVGYSHLAVTDMTMVALLTFGLWQMVVGAQNGRVRPLLIAAGLMGLATSAKYNAGAAVIPLICVAFGVGSRRPDFSRGGLRLSGQVVGVWTGGFILGTPYAILDAGHFVSDFIRQNRIVANGWLGFEDTGPGWRYNLSPVLSGSIGSVLLGLGIVGIAVALWRRRRADLALGLFAIGYFAYVSAWSAHFDRYLLPIIPIIVVLASRAVVEASDALAPRIAVRPVVTAGAAAVAILAPAALSSEALVSQYERRDLRSAAVPVIERIIPLGARVAVDPLGPPLVDRATGLHLAASGHRVHWFRLTRFETPQPGVARDRKRSLAYLKRRQIRWVIVSSDIERRVRASRGRYPREVAFYRALRKTARLRYRVLPSLGPGVALWDLGPTGPPRVASAARSANVAEKRSRGTRQ